MQQARIKSLKAQKFDKRQNVTEKQHASYAETFKSSVNSSKTMVKKFRGFREFLVL